MMVTLSNGTILQTIQRIKVMKSNKVKEISLIGILAAVNIASRIYLQALPKQDGCRFRRKQGQSPFH